MTSLRAKVYTKEGTENGTVELPKEIFDVPMNVDLLHQAVRTYQTNARKDIAHTKTRAEVRGGGRKPWRQKHTGRARHGSIRSPLWRGGGVTFGPRTGTLKKLKLPEKMRRAALFVALSQKYRDDELFIIDSLVLPEAKTKVLVEMLSVLPQKGKSTILVVSEKNTGLARAARNIEKTRVVSAENLNAFLPLSFKRVLLEKDAIKKIQETFLTSSR